MRIFIRSVSVNAVNCYNYEMTLTIGDLKHRLVEQGSLASCCWVYQGEKQSAEAPKGSCTLLAGENQTLDLNLDHHNAASHRSKRRTFSKVGKDRRPDTWVKTSTVTIENDALGSGWASQRQESSL